MIDQRHEYTGSIHLHTSASDGAATHFEVAQLAARAGLDFLVVTDHNVLSTEAEAWYGDVLLLVGEEIHDTTRVPEANHYLALNIKSHVSAVGSSAQQVIDGVNSQGGFGFIAHPFEHSPPFTGEPELPWVEWGVRGYAGLEIWNYMSEFKSYLHNLKWALLFILFPHLAMTGPFPETLAKWDELLSFRRTAAIAGTDAHGNTYSLGPLRRAVLPYEHCFRALRNHIFTRTPFDGTLEHDRGLVYDALKHGRSFIAYDALGDSTGFSFQATGGPTTARMGEQLHLSREATLEVSSPLPAELRIVHNGEAIAETHGRSLRHTVKESGVYRVEAYRTYLRKRRGWVFTNPIYVLA
jgi:hypothetical protein